MIYDKKTGDVQIIDKSKGKKKPIIRSHDDLDRERNLIEKELDKDNSLATDEDWAVKKATLVESFIKKHNVDPSKF